jgi:hypothetical protein
MARKLLKPGQRFGASPNTQVWNRPTTTPSASCAQPSSTASPSLGSQSGGGELRTARLLSAHTTCRLQKRSLFVYLTEALTANARGDPVPLLA